MPSSDLSQFLGTLQALFALIDCAAASFASVISVQDPMNPEYSPSRLTACRCPTSSDIHRRRVEKRHSIENPRLAADACSMSAKQRDLSTGWMPAIQPLLNSCAMEVRVNFSHRVFPNVQT
jgi:hypothetical protein